MRTRERIILVTSALPYANGPIHIGHMLEYIQTDIWVRFHRLSGQRVTYVCADDAHGTPIMLRADKQCVSPEQLITSVRREHERDFSGFLISFDHYHSTHSDENRKWCNSLYSILSKRGHIARRTITQLYDAEENMFLPDRYIQGECPRCHAPEQYGDHCEVCNSAYSPIDLINPISVVSKTTPVVRSTEHLFFCLPHFAKELEQFILSGVLQKEVKNKSTEWFSEGLREWDISRDAPYFGFSIPGEKDKFFYVWLDAPIGYLASLEYLCRERGEDIMDYLKKDSDTEMYHFIGKDIIYFHALFWPALLMASDLRLPTGIFAHGFLTVNGEKMSKSRGTFITAESYLRLLDPECIRYYFATKLTAKIEDIDLNLDDFVRRVNSDLIGKVINIASRCATFIQKHFAGQLLVTEPSLELFTECQQAASDIARHYEARELGQAMRSITQLADSTNRYIDSKKPWLLIKTADRKKEVQTICSWGLNIFRLLIIYLKPVLPNTATKAEKFLAIPPLLWQDSQSVLNKHVIGSFEPLMQRIEQHTIDQLIQDNVETLKPQKVSSSEKSEPAADKRAPCSTALIPYSTFEKIDLRVAKIIKAEYVEGAKKLLRLTVDLNGETREILAGIRGAYQPEALEGRLTVVIANLEPRKMRFGVSAGMVLAAGDNDEGPFLLTLDDGAKPGMRIK